MSAVMWVNAALLAGGVLTLATSLDLGLHGASRIVDKLRNRLYERKIDELEKQRTLLKYATITKKEHAHMLAELKGERDILQERVKTLIERQKELNTRVYELTRENKHLTGTEKKHRELVKKLAFVKEDYEEVLEQAREYRMLLNEYLDPLMVEVLLALSESHPYTVTTQDLAEIVEQSAERVLNACSKLSSQKWVVRTANRHDVYGAQWRINPRKRQHLFAHA